MNLWMIQYNVSVCDNKGYSDKLFRVRMEVEKRWPMRIDIGMIFGLVKMGG